MRTLVVRNPASGSSDDVDFGAVEWSLRRLGPVEILDTSSRAALPAEVRAAAQSAELVIIAGGDGTMGDVVNALADRLDEISFGMLPAGTGNDLARTLGLPLDPLACAASLDPRALVTIDVGRVSNGAGERLFVNACMGGFPVEVDEAIDEGHKRSLGPLAFWVGGASAAADLRRATVRVNGREVRDCVAVGIGNGRSAGGGTEVWPDADPSDGLLDICALGARGALAAARVALRVARGTHRHLDSVYAARARRVVVEAEPAVEFNVDGELAGFSTPAEFGIAGAITMIVCA